MTTQEIKHLQHSMNAFVERNKSLGFTKLQEDGEWGRLTKQRIRDIKWLLGYSRKNLKVQVGQTFFKRMNHPNQVEPAWKQTKLAVKHGKKRRRLRRIRVRQLKVHAVLASGVGTFDGKPVAKTAIPVLTWCREHGWRGQLVSGWRSAVYSEGLCKAICGRPSCPGRCAGRSTNHTGNSPDRFAMDVSDYINFGNVVAKCPIKPHVHNSLPNDRVHFSPSGR